MRAAPMNERQAQELLCRFEPVIRYTQGEQFFPMDAARYVNACSLWVQQPGHLPELLVPTGELTLDRLAEPRAHGPRAIYFLKLVEPPELMELAAQRVREGWHPRQKTVRFHAGPGRLARVGYTSRFVDALFSLSLLARGRVPGDTAAAASLTYQRIQEEATRFQYYGRVIQQQGWTILQYWFFYPFNDWRSGFYGANDHEADWETAAIYLYEDEQGELYPEWVAYAMHDVSGDDLRRRWDDPELEKVGEHPVIYAGAGSHANYFQPGEYLTELELPFLTPVVQFVDRLQRAWERSLWGRPTPIRWSRQSLFRVPFVDYARGDGTAIGFGQAQTWLPPVIIEPPPPWVSQYRGLWGLYANDPFSGEDAPAGPMYGRGGAMRRAWYAPLAWAGLDKVPPPPQRLALVQARLAEIETQQEETAVLIAAKAAQLTGLGVEIRAMQNKPHLRLLLQERVKAETAVSAELTNLRADLAANTALAESLQQYAAQIRDGERGPIRGHIHRAHHATSAAGMRLSRFAEAWAALSIGLLMIGFVLLALFAREFLFLGLISLIAVVLFVEASARRSLTRLVASITNALAVVAGLVLLFQFFWQVVVILVLVAGSYIMRENIRELRQ